MCMCSTWGEWIKCQTRRIKLIQRDTENEEMATYTSKSMKKNKYLITSELNMVESVVKGLTDWITLNSVARQNFWSSIRLYVRMFNYQRTHDYSIFYVLDQLRNPIFLRTLLLRCDLFQTEYYKDDLILMLRIT